MSKNYENETAVSCYTGWERRRGDETQVEKTEAAIDYIEGHLSEKLNLELVAEAVHYSKYYLHRIFTQTTGLTVHDYVKRRQLTEAAKLLVFSEKPIVEIAFLEDMKASRRLQTALRQCTKRRRDSTGKSGNFTRCSFGIV